MSAGALPSLGVVAGATAPKSSNSHVQEAIHKVMICYVVFGVTSNLISLTVYYRIVFSRTAQQGALTRSKNAILSPMTISSDYVQ